MEDVCAVGDTYDPYWNWIPSCSSRSVTNKNAFATVLFPAVSMINWRVTGNKCRDI
jgi:hypothetical protein